ncbi:MAG: hypothetical protein PHF31_15550 [Methylobacter sp.]|nr:hypothetical protein [Methylobacter sp.]
MKNKKAIAAFSKLAGKSTSVLPDKQSENRFKEMANHSMHQAEQLRNLQKKLMKERAIRAKAQAMAVPAEPKPYGIEPEHMEAIRRNAFGEILAELAPDVPCDILDKVATHHDIDMTGMPQHKPFYIFVWVVEGDSPFENAIAIARDVDEAIEMMVKENELPDFVEKALRETEPVRIDIQPVQMIDYL